MAVTACAEGNPAEGVDEADELLGRRLGGVLLRDGIGLHMREAVGRARRVDREHREGGEADHRDEGEQRDGADAHGWRGIVHRLTPLTYRAVSSA